MVEGDIGQLDVDVEVMDTTSSLLLPLLFLLFREQ